MKTLFGEQFGWLTALHPNGKQGHNYMWDCFCSCGNYCRVRSSHLVSGATRSCGCFRRQHTTITKTIHGMKDTLEHNSWLRMRGRCLDPNNNEYHRYGGRGIKICERWMEFQNFYDDMGVRPAGFSLDRKESDGDYEPSNCQWSDAVTQQNNKRNNVRLTIGDVTKTIAQWGRQFGYGSGLINNRLRRGWSVDDAIKTSPSEYRGGKK